MAAKQAANIKPCIQRGKIKRLTALPLIALPFITLLSVSNSVSAFSDDQTATQSVELTDEQSSEQYSFHVPAPEKLAKKLYRKALFHYFQGESELALRQLTYNKARLSVVDDNALLFEAGLQVSLGLYREAEKNLTAITTKLHKASPEGSAENEPDERFDYLASQDLLAVALLQLAEQQISQQQQQSAQQTLAKLHHLPDGYYQQYHILSQLAYWPKSPNLQLEMPIAVDSGELKNQQADAYILLNTALMLIEQKDVESAEQKLMQLKLMSWQAPEQSFWQQLFSNDDSANLLTKNAANHEKQSLQDYASLILAQLYVEQEQFSLAYKELANFPQNSPFTEQALFLFAYASLQTQHYPESEAIFSLLSTRYPTSYLGWQADVLLAGQYLTQRNIDTALNQYLQLETKYQQQLNSLAQFEQQLIATPVGASVQLQREQLKNESALHTSVWWEKAIASVKLTGQLDKANELEQLTNKIAKQQQQVKWLDYAIALNERRQAKIIAQQQSEKYQSQINQLQQSRDQLASRLADAKVHKNATLFASPTQQEWLERITKSQSVLNVMANNDRYKKKVPKYQQRLNRVEGVLAWQLQQKFPQRLWKHQTQLKQVDQHLVKLTQQMEKVVVIQQLAKNNNAALDDHTMTNAGIDLPTLKQRQQKIAQNSLRLKNAVAALENSTNKDIQTELLAFIAEQRQSLNYYLHHSRRAMAKILEELKKIDIAQNDNPQINKASKKIVESSATNFPNVTSDVVNSEGVEE